MQKSKEIQEAGAEHLAEMNPQLSLVPKSHEPGTLSWPQPTGGRGTNRGDESVTFRNHPMVFNPEAIKYTSSSGIYGGRH